MPGVATAQLLTYAEIVDVDLDATNDVNFADVEDYGHRVQIEVDKSALNNYLRWTRDVGSARPSAALDSTKEAAFKDAISAGLSKSLVDIDGVSGGLHFGTANLDTNPDPRKRASGVSVNDVPLCFVLYKLYGSSAVATLDMIYNLADAMGMLSNETVSTAITESFKAQVSGSLDTMFRDLLAVDPHRFFDASGLPMAGIFETNADVAGSGNWKLTDDDILEVKLKMIFHSRITRRGVAGRENNLTSTATENAAGPQENQQTVINPDDYFYIRLQMKSKDLGVADTAFLTYQGTKVTGYTGPLVNATLVIPSGVTEIDNNAFKNKTGLASVVLPSGLTRIGDNAFEGCTSLQSVSIPSTVTSIRHFAFIGCSALTSISIPGATSISPYAFANCTSASSLSIPNITSIGSEAFNNCRFTSVSIPASVTSWDNSSFSSNPALLSVTIANGITAIPNYAFFGCGNLSSVSLPASLTSIGGNVFRACTGLTSISIPSSVTTLGSGAFNETRLVSVVLPNCGTIGDYCFKDIPTLTSVTFNSFNLIVGSEAFRYTNLANVVMPNVTTIGDRAFANNDSLLTVSAPNATSVAANAFDSTPNLTSHP
jgi:hypothetical protein